MVPSHLRYGVAAVAGAIIAVALFYIMQAVISTDENPLNEAPKTPNLGFVRVIEDIPVKLTPPQLDEPPPPIEMPQDIPEVDLSDDGDGFLDVDVGGPRDFSVDFDGFGIEDWDHDGDYLPLNKVEPEYPTRALQRGIEGFVVVEFVVTKDGNVENPVVVEAKPRGIFERSALRAAVKFKYKPKVVNGEAVPVSGVKNRIIYQLDEKRR